jgi:acetoin utilization protein AcuB
MYVGLKMLRDFETVTPKTPVNEAIRILDESKLWMLLVVEDDKLVGYVRKEDLTAALPSMMTTLEKHELHYLMTKLTVAKIMRKDIRRVSPETEIEVAADIMEKENLAGLAVMTEDGRLVGYINRTVMLDVLVEELGLRLGGSRIVFEVADRTGVLHEVSGLIASKGVSIISTATFFHNDRRMVVIRVALDDPSSIAASLQELGYRPVTAEDFVEEWVK